MDSLPLQDYAMPAALTGAILVALALLLFLGIGLWLLTRGDNSQSRGKNIFWMSIALCYVPLTPIMIAVAVDFYNGAPDALPIGIKTLSICVTVLAVSLSVHKEYVNETDSNRMPRAQEHFIARFLFWICDKLYVFFGSNFARAISPYAMLILVFPTIWTMIELGFVSFASVALRAFLALVLSIAVLLGARLADRGRDDFDPQGLLLFGSLMGVGYWYVYPWLHWTLFQEGPGGLVLCIFATYALFRMLRDLREQYLSRVNTLAATDIALPAAAGSDE